MDICSVVSVVGRIATPMWRTYGLEVSCMLRLHSPSDIYPLVMGYSTDGIPHIGQVPSKPNQFILAGFNGHGMPLIFLSARGIASMIMKQKNFAESGIPRIFETSQERLDSKKNFILDGWKAFQTQ